MVFDMKYCSAEQFSKAIWFVCCFYNNLKTCLFVIQILIHRSTFIAKSRFIAIISCLVLILSPVTRQDISQTPPCGVPAWTMKMITSLYHLYVLCNAAACDLPRHITQPLLP